MSRLTIQRGDSIYCNEQAGVKVLIGWILPQGTPVAIKEQSVVSLAQANSAIREALNLSILTHDSIVKVHETFIEQGEQGGFKTVMVMDYMESDLFKEIQKKQELGQFWPENEILWHLHTICEALNLAQKHNICHRDIKPQNVLVTGNVMKLGDFGTSKLVFENGAKTLQGSPLYLSPELKTLYGQYLTTSVMPQSQYDPYKSDVYSLGVTFLHMATLEAPTQLMNMSTLPQATEAVLQTMSKYEYFPEYLRLMLKIYPDERPSFEQIITSINQYFSIQMNTAEVVQQPQYNSVGFDDPTPQDPYQMQNQQVSEILTQPFYGDQTDPTASFFSETDPRSTPNSDAWVNLAPTMTPSTSIPSNAINPSAFFKSCSICQKQISDLSWTAHLPQEFLVYQNIASDYCSLECLKKLKPKTTRIECVLVICRRIIKENEESRKEVIRLECGHVFHYYGCLLAYMCEQSVNFSQEVPYNCPKCTQPINPMLIENAFNGETNLKKSIAYTKEPGCQSCGSMDIAKKLPCPHWICKPCISSLKGQGRQRCKKCHSRFIFRPN